MSILPGLFRSAVPSAVHLEMRDVYEPDDPDWIDWREGHRFNPAERWAPWFTMMSDTTGRGLKVRRARIPAVDFWIFDGTVLALNHFDGYGALTGQERLDDADLAVRYGAAFEEIWDRATPHEEYVI